MLKRQQELKELDAIYEEARNQMILLYGSHRSGISELVRDFVKDKKHFYYMAANASEEQQLFLLRDEIQAKYDIKIQKNTYDECFNRIKSGDPSKLVVVIDEFSRIAKRDKSFFESLIRLKDRKLYPGPVMILLLCRDLTFAREDIAEYLGDDAEYIDYRMELSDFRFLDVVREFSGYSVDECVRAYGIFGGVGDYLSLLSPKKTVRENICELVLSREGLLFNEAEDYIGRQLRELSVYDTILYSMAKGNEKLNDLYRDTGYSRAKISVYLKNLAAFDVVEKVVSFDTGGWDHTKKGIYRIRNRFLEFWFCFVYPHQSDLFIMDPFDFYDKYIAGALDEFLGRAFTAVCSEYLDLLNKSDKLPINVEKTGTWIGKEGTIDIIGQSEDREHIVGICNWTPDELKMEEYNKLMENVKLARLSPRAVYLFSSKNFDIKLRALEATDEKVTLVDMSQL